MEISRQTQDLSVEALEIVNSLTQKDKLLQNADLGNFKVLDTDDGLKLDTKPFGTLGLGLETVSQTEGAWILQGAPVKVAIHYIAHDKQVEVVVKAEVNMMMKAMVKKPLEKLAEKVVKTLENKYN